MSRVAEIPRSQVIDLVKGISIALVAFGHSALPHHLGGLNGAFALFRMPLFFVISGALLSTRAGTFDLAVRKADALLKPYLVVSLALLCATLLSGDEEAWLATAGTLWGTAFTVRWMPLWFLPHLWLVTVALRAFLSRAEPWLGVNPLRAAATVALMFACGVGLVNALRPVEMGQALLHFRLPAGLHNPGLPFSADLLFLTGSYVLAGYLLRRPLRRFIPKLSLVALAAVTWLAVALGSDAAINFSERLYRHPPLALVASAAGIYLVLSGCWWLQRWALAAAVLTRLGRASLIILILHAPISAKAYGLLLAGWPTWGELPSAWLAWGLSVLIPVGVHALLLRAPTLGMIVLPLPWLHRRVSRRPVLAGEQPRFAG